MASNSIVYTQDGNSGKLVDQSTSEASYIIYQNNGQTFALNCGNSQIDSRGTSSGTVIQYALDAVTAAGGGRVSIKEGSYTISTYLIIGSNTKLDAGNATITLTAGSNCNMLRNTAVTANRSVSDAAITSGSKNLTSATANFTSADVGATVIVANAGSSNQKFVSTIVSRTNSTTVVLATAAGATVSSKALAIHYRDTNIEVCGGLWDRGANTTSSWQAHSLLLRHIDNVSVHDIRLNCTALGYNLSFGDVNKYYASNVIFNASGVSSDGLHVDGPATAGYMSNITGTTGDDLVSLTAANYTGYDDTVGDITDCEIVGILPINALCAFKLITGTGVKARAITVRGIHGSTTTAGIRIMDDLSGATDVDGITIENVDVQTGSGYAAAEVKPSAGKQITFKDFTWRQTGNNHNGMIQFTNPASGTANLTNMIVDGINIENGTNSNVISVSSGNLNTLTVKNAQFLSTAVTYTLVSVTSTGSVDNLIVSDCIAYVGNATEPHHTFTNSATLKNVQLSNIYISGGGKVFINTSSAQCNIVANNVTLVGILEIGDSSGPMNMIWNNLYADVTLAKLFTLTTASAVVTIRGSGLTNVNSTTTFTRDGSQTPRIVHAEMQADVATLAKNNGDICYNTNATANSSTIGTGVCLSNGSNWKNVYSGNTA
jgi:hypothetical protein